MKINRIIYWVSTILSVLAAGSAGFMYFSKSEIAEGFKHLGFPDYFRKELGAGKLIGVVILLIPQIPSRIKEWAYVALGITYISAFIAHLTVDGMSAAMAPVIVLLLLITSYITYHRLQVAK